MSVLYRLSKVTSPKAKGYGKWYPRAVITQTVDTEMLATIMQRNCTLKKADIVAVISELIETMADQLQDSKRVKLNLDRLRSVSVARALTALLTSAPVRTSKACTCCFSPR